MTEVCAAQHTTNCQRMIQNFYLVTLLSTVILRIVCPFLPIRAPTYSLGTNILQELAEEQNEVDKADRPDIFTGEVERVQVRFSQKIL
jgi:hypothetical protein